MGKKKAKSPSRTGSGYDNICATIDLVAVISRTGGVLYRSGRLEIYRFSKKSAMQAITHIYVPDYCIGD